MNYCVEFYKKRKKRKLNFVEKKYFKLLKIGKLMKKKLYLTNLIFIIFFCSLNYLNKDIGGRSFDALTSIFAMLIYNLVYSLLLFFKTSLRLRLILTEIVFLFLIGLLFFYEMGHKYSLNKENLIKILFISMTIISLIIFCKIYKSLNSENIKFGIKEK
tara:strand:- start:166 stop:642 length:477 start_codon:yes stop_codon:yes gene_type:complete